MSHLTKLQLKERAHIIDKMHDGIIKEHPSMTLEEVNQKIECWLNDPIKLRVINAIASLIGKDSENK